MEPGPKDISRGFHVSYVTAMLRHASMSTTYKPALLKAPVRICRKDHGLIIPLTELGSEFAQMYWNQTVVFHLRQAAIVSKEAEVVRRIRSIATEYGAHSLADLPQRGRAQIETSMSRVLAIDVLRRFHNSKPDDMAMLYEWNHGDSEIRLSIGSLTFLRNHGATLELIANYRWAEYLESCNRLAPRIIQKVSRDGAMRGSLTKYLKLLLGDDGGCCFYCARSFSHDNPPAVDHVIPWSFLLEDPIWDLVPACARCNAAKSDWLPAPNTLSVLPPVMHATKKR